MATLEIRLLKIFRKASLVQTVIIYENKSGLQRVESVDTQVKPYQSAQFQGVKVIPLQARCGPECG